MRSFDLGRLSVETNSSSLQSVMNWNEFSAKPSTTNSKAWPTTKSIGAKADGSVKITNTLTGRLYGLLRVIREKRGRLSGPARSNQRVGAVRISTGCDCQSGRDQPGEPCRARGAVYLLDTRAKAVPQPGFDKCSRWGIDRRHYRLVRTGPGNRQGPSCRSMGHAGAAHDRPP